MIADSAFTDSELSGWLRKAEEQGNNFFRSMAESAFLGDSQTYAVLRPLLIKLKLKEDESRSATSSSVLDRDGEEKGHDPSGPRNRCSLCG